jgi:hypothetical protein
VLGALATGDSSVVITEHLATCGRCSAARANMRGGGVVRAVPPRPSIAALRGRERRQRAVAACALALVVAGGWFVARSQISSPPVAAHEGLLDAWVADREDLLPPEPLAVSILDPVGPDPLADLHDPTELFDADLGEGSL